MKLRPRPDPLWRPINPPTIHVLWAALLRSVEARVAAPYCGYLNHKADNYSYRYPDRTIIFKVIYIEDSGYPNKQNYIF
jgi:hypothetical protein